MSGSIEMDLDDLRSAIGRESMTHMDATDETVCELIAEIHEAAIALMQALHDRGVARADAIGIVAHTSIIAMLSPA